MGLASIGVEFENEQISSKRQLVQERLGLRQQPDTSRTRPPVMLQPLPLPIVIKDRRKLDAFANGHDHAGEMDGKTTVNGNTGGSQRYRTT